MSKSAWLEVNGRPVTQDEVFALDLSGPELPVALVDNGAFHAAAIIYDERERSVLRDFDDRPVVFFVVPRTVLETEFPP